MTDTLKALDERTASRRDDETRWSQSLAVQRYNEAESDFDTLREIVKKLMEAGTAMDATWQRHGNYFREQAFLAWRTLIDSLRDSE